MSAIHLSTIGTNAADLARQHGLGIEVAEFSYAVNFDVDYEHWLGLTQRNLDGIDPARRILHAPFNELCPAAIEPLVAEVTRHRFDQAYALACELGISRMVVHSGFIPHIYFVEWFADRAAEFFNAFLADKPAGFELLVENVMEEGPEPLCEIVSRTADSRLRICLDVGHAGGNFSKTPVADWVEATAPYLAHAHIHNNYQTADLHNPPGDGLIDMRAVMASMLAANPAVTFSAETEDAASAVEWFKENGFI